MKKNLQRSLLSAAVILFTSINVHAQWSAVAPVYGGTIANDGAVSFTINNKGYVVSGSSTGDMYMYDTLANSWSLVGTIPAAMGHAFAMSFVINGKGYVIGGDTAGVPISTVWEFDPAATVNPWTQKNDFPGLQRDAGFGFAINNYGYAGAGFDGSNLYNDIWKYDASLDHWTLLTATIPINGLIFPTSFVAGDKGFILTGGTSPSGVNEITNMWCLDATTDSLTAKSDFPGAGRQAAFAFSNNLFGFVGGGQSNYATNYSDIWMYDVVNDHWTQSANAPLFGSAWSSAFVIGNTAYAGLGAKLVGTALQGNDDFFKFPMDVATGVNNISNNSHWTIYPNPAMGVLHVDGNFSFSAKVTIADIFGQPIIEDADISICRNISLEKMNPGLYFIRIKENNSIQEKIFIKE